MTSIEEKDLLYSANNLKRSKEFMATKKIKNYFYIDEINKLWCVPKISFWTNELKREKTLFYSYSDIVSFELQLDGKTVTSSTSGGLGSAVVGGLLFGGVGAIVGSNTGKKHTNTTVNSVYTINITINSMKNPNISIDIDNKKTANELISALQLIYNLQKSDNDNRKNTSITNNKKDISVADEIKKFKELLDINAITQEEFDTKKKELLSTSSINYNNTNYIYQDNYNQKVSTKIKCKVCEKEIEYNENETCEQCDKIIRERLEQKCKINAIEESSVSTIQENNSTKEDISRKEKPKEKRKAITFFLCLLLGFIGAHKFYEGKIKTGLLYLCTFGILGFGWIIDIILIVSKKDEIYNPKEKNKDIDMDVDTFELYKIINIVRYVLGSCAILAFLNNMKINYIGNLFFAFSIFPFSYKLLLKFNPQIDKKTIKKVSIFAPIIILLLIIIFGEPDYIREENIELAVGENYDLNFYVVPKNYELISSNTEILSIENNTVIPQKEGNASVQLKIDNEIKDVIEFSIKYLELSNFEVSINPTLDIGSVHNIDVIYTPQNASNKSLTITSTNNNVISIENNQLICNNVGDCIISVSSYNGITKEYPISVIEPVKSVEIKDSTIEMKAGETKKIAVSINPKNATNKNLKWSSSDNSIATVDNDGNITAHKKGSVAIMAASHNGLFSVSTVNVKEYAPITINKFRYTMDYLGGVEWTFSITNNTEKVINYIKIKWDCFNAVGDPIYDEISWKNYVGLTYTGPLKPHKNSGTKRNMTKFYNSSYASATLSYLEIIYEDGTTKVIEGVDLASYENLINN